MSRLIYIYQNDRQEGPYSSAQVEQMLDDGLVSPITLAWEEGRPGWAPLRSILSPEAPSDAERSSPPAPDSLATDSGASPVPPATAGPQGVGGWLVFFCIALTILGPLYSFGQMVAGWESAQPVFSQFPSLRSAIVWESIGYSAVLVYGIVVGAIIWGGSPNGRAVARRFLLIRLIAFVGIELVALVLMGDLPREVVSAAIQGILGAGFRELVFFGVWWSYFQRSKRVRNTYGEPRPALGRVEASEV